MARNNDLVDSSHHSKDGGIVDESSFYAGLRELKRDLVALVRRRCLCNNDQELALLSSLALALV